MVEAAARQHGLRRLLGTLGPGVTTGAADDDPSGIATYSVIGAQSGTTFLWTALFIWPLMGCVQMMCARIGMVTGMGLAGAMRQKFPSWVVGVIAFSLLVANVINIAADLAGMADAAHMLGAGPSTLYVWLFAASICAMTIGLRYREIAEILKWLALALFAYVITAVLVHPHWSSVLYDAVVPSLPRGSAAWGALVALLGTTISPYLFFWQAGQEVEEAKARGRQQMSRRIGLNPREIEDRRIDVAAGTFFSNLAMFFIILTTAVTLHQHGITHISTSREAAEALRPLAGDYAYFLYTLGIVGTGLLAIPTLAGSAAYAVAIPLGLVIIFAYYALYQYMHVLGASGHADPFVAAFLPDMVALGDTHGNANLSHGDGHVRTRKYTPQGRDGGPAAVVHYGSGPVENYRA